MKTRTHVYALRYDDGSKPQRIRATGPAAAVAKRRGGDRGRLPCGITDLTQIEVIRERRATAPPEWRPSSWHWPGIVDEDTPRFVRAKVFG